MKPQKTGKPAIAAEVAGGAAIINHRDGKSKICNGSGYHPRDRRTSLRYHRPATSSRPAEENEHA